MAHVLVADDDSTLRDTLRMALEDEGHMVTLVGDGQAALQTLRTAPQPTVALLDSLMPKLNAEDIVRAVAMDRDLARRHPILGSVPLGVRSRWKSPI